MRRVGLNLLYLVPGKVGGTEVYARRLVHALATARPDWTWLAYCGRDAVDALREERWPANVTLQPAPRRSSDKASRAALEQSWLAIRAARDGIDLVHSLGTTSPIATRCPRVVTVHDLIYLHFPATFPRAARIALKTIVGPGARRSDRVIADSEAGKRDITTMLGVSADRIDVAHLGCNIVRTAGAPEAAIRGALGLADRRICLCVSAALVHKNLETLIIAFGRLAHRRPDLQLVIAGHAGREMARLRALADATGSGERIALTGWISDTDLEGLYAIASCCVYPSLLEGFGLPVLEAMGRGVPLACSDASCLPEVAGDAAELFDARDGDALITAVERLLDDPPRAAELVRRGRERVTQFTWERCADATIESYERAVPGGERS